MRRGVATGNRAMQRAGSRIVLMMPGVLTGLAYLGTVAMLAVGGGILAHHVPAVAAVAHGGGAFAGVIEMTLATLLGGVAGGVLVAVAHLLKRRH
jgi:predicted DNA repair protein MutK